MTSNKETELVARTLPTMYDAGYSGASSYDRLYRAVLSGQIPSEPGPNGGRRIRCSDFPTVAAVLGLKPPVPSTPAQHTAEAEHLSA